MCDASPYPMSDQVVAKAIHLDNWPVKVSLTFQPQAGSISLER